MKKKELKTLFIFPFLALAIVWCSLENEKPVRENSIWPWKMKIDFMALANEGMEDQLVVQDTLNYHFAQLAQAQGLDARFSLHFTGFDEGKVMDGDFVAEFGRLEDKARFTASLLRSAFSEVSGIRHQPRQTGGYMNLDLPIPGRQDEVLHLTNVAFIIDYENIWS